MAGGGVIDFPGIDAIVHSDAFGGTLRRSLPAGTFERTVGNAEYRNYMATEMTDLLARIRDGDLAERSQRPNR